MNRNKIIALTLAASISASLVPANLTFAQENTDTAITASVGSNEVKVSKFTLNSLENYKEYEEAYKAKVASYSNNGGKYSSSSLDKAFDGNIATHWETGKANSTSFTNEVIVTFENVEAINRIVYAARQDASQKGYATKFSIYASVTEDGDDFELVGKGNATRTAALTEFKFATVEAKRIKFVFDEAYNSWASASELMFFKEDSVSDKMERLFTDSTLATVSEEFNTIEKINALEEEVKNHLLYSKFKEDIENAKIIVEQQKVETSTAEISKFKVYDTSYINEYDNVFRIASDKITSITNNGGNYPNAPLTNAIDADINTHWETGTPNSGSFKNEVYLTLEAAQLINRVVYKSRSGGKGFAKNFSIYVSATTKGDNFTKVTTGEYSVTNDLLEIKFEEVKAKRIKFVFDNANDSWASIGDLRLYREDTVTDKMEGLFTDGLNNQVSEEYNTLEKINALMEDVKGHPLEEEYIKQLNSAKDLLNGIEINGSEIITLSQRGNENTKRAELRQIFAGGNLDVTGYYVMPGETVEVYVDADENGYIPQIAFAQVGEVDGAGNHRISLTIGKNVVTAPSGTKAFAIYFTNRALPEEQAFAPRVRIAGDNLKTYPVYIDGVTDPEEYVETVKNHTGPNMTDVVGERYLLSVQNSEAKIAYVDRGKSPTDTAEAMDKMISLFDEIAGYDENDPNSVNRPSKALYHYKATNASGLYASNEYIHYSASSARSILAGEVYGWGYLHEFAHQIENADMRLLEVTNNIYSVYIQHAFGMGSRLDGAQGVIDKYFTYDEGTKGFGGFGVTYDLTLDLFGRLAVLTQFINYFGLDTYSEANRLVRENPSRYISTGSYQSLITAMSEASGYDLSPHFEYYNYPVTDKTKEFTSQFKTLDKKLRYITMTDYSREKDGVELFASDTKASIDNIARNSDGFTLSLSVNNHSDALTIYEIYRDGEFVGISRNGIFKDNIDSSKEYDYEVIAYDYKVNESIKSEVVSTKVSYKPILIGRDNLTIKINEEFNALDYIEATNYNNEVIAKENIKVTNTVNTTEKGTYEVTYEVEDNDYVVSKTMKVTVVSSYDYLSDSEWTSVETAWGTPRRNSSIQGRVNGEIRNFAKGFGIHANGKIVYDLSNHNYDTFEALLGVDTSIAAQDRSSITFKIIADGEVLATTNTLKYADNMVAISVPVTGVKELAIEITDGGNGNASDHAVIANPILTTNNTKPVINAKTETVIKLGTEFDIMAGVTASDVEDGDLTSNIEVISNTYESGKVGKFAVTYQVTDGDNNVTEKTSYVTVYEEITATKSKFAYLSNLEEYNESFKIPVASVSNNGGNYGSSVIKYAVDGNRATHWETGNPNSSSFQNEVIFDLGSLTEIDKLVYAARSGGKGFATKFEVYISNEAEGDNFRLATVGSYSGSVNDVIEIDIDNTEARRVKFKFVEANQGWASIGEMTFYKTDELAERIANDLFVDSNKTAVTESYNTLEKLEALRAEVNSYSAASLFQADLNKAEEIIRASFPTVTVPKAITTKLGVEIDLEGEFSATDKEDGDITSRVEITNNVNFNKTGKYEVTYTVKDSQGNVSSAVRTVYVTDMESYKYLGDMEWKSTTASYTAVRKNISISGNTLRLTAEDGSEVSYEKGLGAHSTSTITYDLTKGDFTNFTSYVGVDRRMYNTIASVSFEVHLDGTKVYDSGLMNSKDSQKFIDLDVTGAKEMKLVVTDGGNGNGSDHATFGDARLYNVNLEGIEVDRADLDKLVDTITKLNEIVYSEETWANLQATLVEVNDALKDGYNQIEIDGLYNKLNEAYTSLEQIIDLNEVVNISDSELKRLVKETLGLASNDITIGDMYKLTSLVSKGTLITSLDGLQYAKNLEYIEVEYSEIADLSPLKDLSKITDIKISEGYIVVGYPAEVDGKVIIDETRIDITGERLKPTEIKIGNLTNVKYINVEDTLVDGVICINKEEFNSGANSIVVSYEGANGRFQSQSIYMFMK